MRVGAVDFESAVDFGPMRLFVRQCALRSVTLVLGRRRDACTHAVLPNSVGMVRTIDLESAIDFRGCGPMRLFIRQRALRSVTLPVRARRNAEAFTILMDRPRAVDWADDVKNTTLFKILLSIKSLATLGRCVTLLFRFIREGNVCRPPGR